MKPFLYQIADLFLREYGTGISQLAFVFPNRRAGFFFQKHLSEIANRPIFSPKILTINDLFSLLGKRQTADRIRTLFKLYDIYIKASGSAESFDEFLYWGDMLLNDFDDIDKYMVDAGKLFRNVTDLKELDDNYSFLSEEQIQAIRMFWASFYPKHDSPNQQHFLELWEILHTLYSGLKERLAEEGCGYEGMIFREVAEAVEQKGVPDGFPFQKIIFVGLNALSVSEERLLLALQKAGKADFYWDYMSGYVKDPDNKASYFVERNLDLFPSAFHLLEEEAEKSAIKIAGVPSAIGQAKHVYQLLENYMQESPMTAESALRTAIVLPDEHLLVPVLNSIPEAIHPINVTMGYPLSGTPVASLMEHILQLQKNIRYTNGEATYYHKDVLAILNHQYVVAACQGDATSLVNEMVNNNWIYIEAKNLYKDDFLRVLFTPVTSTEELSDYLICILENLNDSLRRGNPEPEEEDMGSWNEKESSLSDIEQEFIFHYFATVNKMKDVMQEANVTLRLDTYFRLLKKMADLVTIPFEGEPLSGLQIMGVLETRALDFDRLIILSMNEGIFPLKKAANSFIPYNLRRGFGLPTYEHQDSIWAYHFYRLIHRAKEVTLLYDTRSSGIQTGEISRYVHQLRYHYQFPLEDQLMVYNVSSSKVAPILIHKDARILQCLDNYTDGGRLALSASSINTYLDCPLKFYYSVVENIQEEEEVAETVESDVFGSIFHKVMEELYLPFKGKMVTADLLKILKKDEKVLTGTIQKAFAEVFFKSKAVRALEGENYLIGELIRKYVIKVLEKDAALTPFHFIHSEQKVMADFPLSDGRKVHLKGFIDRVDEVKEAIRIVDYKTGTGSLQFSYIPDLFDRSLKERPKAVMQVFLYAWIYNQLNRDKRLSIQPSIYYLRTLFNSQFDPAVLHSIGKGKNERVDSFLVFQEEFESEMRKCLEEIFNPHMPFVQTTVEKRCTFCPFASVCGK